MAWLLAFGAIVSGCEPTHRTPSARRAADTGEHVLTVRVHASASDGGNRWRLGQPCSPGYVWTKAAALRDRTGNLLAGGTVAKGAPPESSGARAPNPDGTVTAFECDFEVSFASVPDADSYRIDFRHQRPLTRTRAELQDSGWTIRADLKL